MRWELTDKTMSTADRIVEFVRRYRLTYGYAPTFREIGNAVGLKSTSTVAYRVGVLVKQRRLIAGPPGTPRTLRVGR